MCYSSWFARLEATPPWGEGRVLQLRASEVTSSVTHLETGEGPGDGEKGGKLCHFIRKCVKFTQRHFWFSVKLHIACVFILLVLLHSVFRSFVSFLLSFTPSFFSSSPSFFSFLDRSQGIYKSPPDLPAVKLNYSLSQSLLILTCFHSGKIF